VSGEITLRPIGIVRSCYKEKFGIPRQAGLVPDARATLELEPSAEMRESVRGLSEFSHLWLLYVFHGILDEKTRWKPLVRPPRLGGVEKVGVLASRSPHRPNPIGLSCVKLESVHAANDSIRIEVSGVDLLDGTPLLDVKPYLPYADSIPEARGAWASEAPAPVMKVEFTALALEQVLKKERSPGGYPGLRRLIEFTLGLDPRPANQRGSALSPAGGRPGAGESDSQYAALILDFDLRWEIKDGLCRVLELREPRAYT